MNQPVPSDNSILNLDRGDVFRCTLEHENWYFQYFGNLSGHGDLLLVLGEEVSGIEDNTGNLDEIRESWFFVYGALTIGPSDLVIENVGHRPLLAATPEHTRLSITLEQKGDEVEGWLIRDLSGNDVREVTELDHDERLLPLGIGFSSLTSVMTELAHGWRGCEFPHQTSSLPDRELPDWITGDLGPEVGLMFEFETASSARKAAAALGAYEEDVIDAADKNNARAVWIVVVKRQYDETKGLMNRLKIWRLRRIAGKLGGTFRGIRVIS